MTAPGATPRQEGASVQDWLDRETRPVPAYLRDVSAPAMATIDLPVERWISRAAHEHEMAHMWTRTWQFACLESELANPGDFVVYDIGTHSFVVTRDENRHLHAFHNSCVHRGTRLADGQGHASTMRCPFHGWIYGLNGRLTGLPCEWDFRHLPASERKLREVRADVWQGLVFLNIDPDAPSLADYLGGIDQAFERYPLTGKYKAAHIKKQVACNWKVVLEQFIESYHVMATHPEGMPFLSDANAQYDIWPDRDHVSRMHVLHSVSSPHLGGRYSEQDIMDVVTAKSDKAGAGADRVVVPEGTTARAVLAETRRAMMATAGIDCSAFTDAEMLDTIHYFIFPNIVVWTALGSPMFYRFRPNGDDHETSIMEILFMLPHDPDKPAPPPALPQDLGTTGQWSDAPALGQMGWIFDQDTDNSPRIQAGMKASGKGYVTLANYQESRIRHFHQTLDKYLLQQV